MDKKIIKTEKAPGAIGPYSVGVVANGFVYTAGQVGINPETGKLVEGGIESETRQVLNNVKNILEAAGTSMQKVVKTTVFLQDMGEFSKMNGVYAEFFTENPPARSAVEVAALPLGVSVEIEAIALAE
ncbi:MAG: RidA family protein [Anaerolineaceae bacterium]|nr:RidA family protein [Anaerolineaceae bacterium]